LKYDVMLILSGLHQRSLTALSVFIILLSLGIEFFSPPGVYAGCGYVIAVIIMLYSDDKVKPVLIASAASLAILFSIFLYISPRTLPSLPLIAWVHWPGF